MLRPATLYFFQFAALASPGRFLSLFLASFGLSDAAVGAVLAVPSALTLLSLVGGGLLADAVDGGKLRVVAAGNAVSCAFFQSLAVAHLFAGGGGAAPPSCSSRTRSAEEAAALVGAELGAVGGAAGAAASDGAPGATVAASVAAPPPPDGASAASGAAAKGGNVSGSSECDASADAAAAAADAPAVTASDVAAFCRFLWSDTPSVIFFLAVAMVNVGTSLVENLVFLFFVNDLHASNSLCGVAVVITVIFEIPLFYISEHLLGRFRAPTLLLAGMACYVTRVVAYTLVPADHAGWVLLVEPLHGVTYALVQMASVREAARVAPPALQATGQSFLAVAANGGAIVGTAGGGAVMHAWGAAAAYRTAAALVAVAAVAYAASVGGGGGGALGGGGGGGPATTARGRPPAAAAHSRSPPAHRAAAAATPATAPPDAGGGAPGRLPRARPANGGGGPPRVERGARTRRAVAAGPCRRRRRTGRVPAAVAVRATLDGARSPARRSARPATVSCRGPRWGCLPLRASAGATERPLTATVVQREEPVAWAAPAAVQGASDHRV
ncbi:hypothetical protein BU14_0500s0008 [Porphyra umbilicalis]|uniref:Major facilitator superfamily associated domain-containing protein n=1 Tax=Porphyra umbilicalis TaxID=2786 RepID=A0A1X6NT49_PORUM|nr:hypothetical protein BU14_0500s0008 [Porphyra umbilicalis]|eukprot:OSX71809.1 hypothetical protein BU14_0500s0008 [Porphyra umbilicalis]